jgi:hypothetical protein
METRDLASESLSEMERVLEELGQMIQKMKELE